MERRPTDLPPAPRSCRRDDSRRCSQGGDPLPSVRTVAADYRVNPLTVLKGYQQLVDEELVEKKRGLGMFVKEDARTMLLEGERQKFLDEQWPRVYATIQRLGLKPEQLLRPDPNRRPPSDAEEKER